MNADPVERPWWGGGGQGRDGSHATTWALKAAKDILTESFDPILDGITGRDLLDLMVYAQGAPPWDYTGMHTAVLRHRVPTPPPPHAFSAAAAAFAYHARPASFIHKGYHRPMLADTTW